MSTFDDAVGKARAKEAERTVLASADPTYRREIQKAVAAVKARGRFEPNRRHGEALYQILIRTRTESLPGAPIWQSPTVHHTQYFADESGNLYYGTTTGMKPVLAWVKPSVSEIAAYLVKQDLI